MSLKSFIISVEETAIVEVEKLGATVKHIVLTDGQKAVAELKALPVAQVGLAIIKALVAVNLTGSQKMAAVVGAITPGIEAVKAAGGLAGIEASVKDIAHEFGQSLFTDAADAIATALANAAVSPITGKPLA